MDLALKIQQEGQYFLETVKPLSSLNRITFFMPSDQAMSKIPTSKLESLAGRTLSDVSFTVMTPSFFTLLCYSRSTTVVCCGHGNKVHPLLAFCSTAFYVSKEYSNFMIILWFYKYNPNCVSLQNHRLCKVVSYICIPHSHCPSVKMDFPNKLDKGYIWFYENGMVFQKEKIYYTESVSILK